MSVFSIFITTAHIALVILRILFETPSVQSNADLLLKEGQRKGFVEGKDNVLIIGLQVECTCK